MDPTELSPTQPDLDLAFEADDSLPPELLDQAGDLADPLQGAEQWHLRISGWLEQLAGNCHRNCRPRPTAWG